MANLCLIELLVKKYSFIWLLYYKLVIYYILANLKNLDNNLLF